MNDTQRKKRNFRDSKKWKDFRKTKMLEQKNLCGLSKRKLTGRWALHHLDLNPDKYEDLSDVTKFMCLNKKQHDLIHDLYNGWLHYGNWSYIHRVLVLLGHMVAINQNLEGEHDQWPWWYNF